MMQCCTEVYQRSCSLPVDDSWLLNMCLSFYFLFWILLHVLREHFGHIFYLNRIPGHFMKFQENISNSMRFPGFLLIFRIQRYFLDSLEFQETVETLHRGDWAGIFLALQATDISGALKERDDHSWVEITKIQDSAGTFLFVKLS